MAPIVNHLADARPLPAAPAALVAPSELARHRRGPDLRSGPVGTARVVRDVRCGAAWSAVTAPSSTTVSPTRSIPRLLAPMVDDAAATSPPARPRRDGGDPSSPVWRRMCAMPRLRWRGGARMAAHRGRPSWAAHATAGKAVLEFGVIVTDKGEAVDTLRAWAYHAPAVVFLGDDVTDELAFRADGRRRYRREGRAGRDPGRLTGGGPEDVAAVLRYLAEARLPDRQNCCRRSAAALLRMPSPAGRSRGGAPFRSAARAAPLPRGRRGARRVRAGGWAWRRAVWLAGRAGRPAVFRRRPRAPRGRRVRWVGAVRGAGCPGGVVPRSRRAAGGAGALRPVAPGGRLRWCSAVAGRRRVRPAVSSPRVVACRALVPVAGAPRPVAGGPRPTPDDSPGARRRQAGGPRCGRGLLLGCRARRPPACTDARRVVQVHLRRGGPSPWSAVYHGISRAAASGTPSNPVTVSWPGT